MSQPRGETPRCVVCGKAQLAAVKPFCSKRCADVDLAKWLGGRYAIPAEEPPDADRNGPENGE
jgi:endogenous inhibitor of DNA gyrase (YacG/DUF329 family)